MKMVLDLGGFEVLTAMSLTEAKVQFTGVDVLLTDFNLGPDGTGQDVANLFLIARPEGRVIVSTGSYVDVQCEAHTHLQKPIGIDQLLDAVNGESRR